MKFRLPEEKLRPTEETPKPSDKWPRCANWVASFRKSGDIGVGDTAEHLAALIGGEIFKSIVKAMGFDCGCTDRKEKWNKQYPYESLPTDPSN